MRPERRAALRGLYAVTPGEADDARLFASVSAVLAGGARLVQYRDKALDPARRLDQARGIAALCREHGALFIVNDDLALALAVGADGVHLGREDGEVAGARAAWPGGLLGVSCYDRPSLAAAAAAAGADYVGIGSVFASAVKPGAVHAPLEALGEAGRRSGLPVAAIGGIDESNAAQAVAAGADMIAVITALFAAPDPRAAARALSRPFEPDQRSHVRTQPAAL